MAAAESQHDTATTGTHSDPAKRSHDQLPMTRLLACLLLAAVAAAGEGVWPANLDGLAFAWRRVDSLIEFKTGDYASLVVPRGRAWFGANWEMEADGGHFVSDEASSQALLKRCQASGRFSFEAMVELQGAPADGAIVASFLNEQATPHLQLTIADGKIGVGAVRAAVPAATFHLLLSVDGARPAAQRLQLWIDGKPAAAGAGPDVRTWTQFQYLTFANDWANAHPFRGRLCRVAAGDRAVDDAAATAAAVAAGASYALERIEPQRITFTGTVAGVSGDDPEAAENYVRQLWVVQYQDVRVAAGALRRQDHRCVPLRSARPSAGASGHRVEGRHPGDAHRDPVGTGPRHVAGSGR